MPGLKDRDLGWRHWVLGLLIALAMVGQGGIASAAGGKSAHAAKAKPASEAPPPSADLVAAKQAYEEALRAFNLGQWDEAVAGFQKSYKLSGDAALLFNVAQAQRQAGHVKEAIIAYKAFLRERPATPNREMIEAKIKDLETASEAKTAAQKPGASPAQADRLTGIWEDPFERKPWAPAGPSESPASPVAPGPAAPPSASPVPPEPSAPPAAAPAQLPVAAPVLASPVPPADKPAAAQAALDLGQKPASEESAAASGSGTRWWLWTGIGVVVVAAVVTAVLLSTGSPGRDGTCPSGLDGCIPVGK
jgi:tetratricopeptide (TPR) repeat protein